MLRDATRGLRTRFFAGACLWLIGAALAWSYPARGAPREGDRTWVFSSDGLLALRAVGDARAAGAAIPVLCDGRTLVPLEEEFPACFSNSEAVASALGTWRRGKDRTAYGVLDALRWGAPDSERAFGALGAHPAWAALGRTSRTGPDQVATYASPYRPEVRQLLARLVATAATSMPGLDGIVISCGFGSGEALDFSEAARMAHIERCGFDPVDLDWLSFSPIEGRMIGRWATEQSRVVSALFHELAAAYRTRAPSGVVVGLADASFYWRAPRERGELAADWLAWARAGDLDELWLSLDARADAKESTMSQCMADVMALVRRGGNWRVRAFVTVPRGGFAPEDIEDIAKLVKVTGSLPVVGVPRADDLRDATVLLR